MPDDELLSLLKQEEADATSFYDSEFALSQAEAMKRYNGEKYGDEVEGRSSVVTHDVEDTINWIMPHLMRTFLSSDELVSVESEIDDDALQYDTRCVGEYLTHVFFKDNRGEVVLHDFTFDGLLQRVGCIKATWTDPAPKPPQIIEGVGVEQLIKYEQDPEYEILGTATEDQQTYMIEVRHKPRMGRVVIENVPPEEVAWSKRARSAATADYIRRKREVFVAEIMAQYPEARAELEAPDKAWNSAGNDIDAATDARRSARHGESSVDDRKSSDHWRRRKAYLIEEDVRVDYDGDGIVELRHIKRLGDVILENEIVERSELFFWSPIRIPHKLAGRSVADTMMDFQKIRTVLTRRALDSLAQSLTQQKAVNTSLVDPADIDGILDNDIGHVVKCKGDVRASLMPIETPDISGSALTWLEYTDQKQEQASGATRHNQGVDPKALTKTASGLDMLQSAGMTRIEMYARWLGEALEEIFEHILSLVCRHQDQARIIKIKGKPVSIDPRLWSDEMSVTVHVGLGGETRERKLFNLNMIAGKQEQILLNAGETNPVVSWSEYRTTLQRMVETMGFKNATAFWKEVPEGYQPPEPGKDPKTAEVEGKLQLEQAKAAQTQQLATQKLAADQQLKQAEFAHKQQIAEAEIAGKQDQARIDAANEMQIAKVRIAAETEIAARRTEAEMALARWKTAQEVELAREKMRRDGSAGGDGELDNIDSFRPGGSLGA